MRKYQVYSVGMALVDLQFKLRNIDDLGIKLEAGGTNLIDADQEEKLLQRLAHLSPVQTCGGSGANTLSVIQGLGGKVFYTCKVGKDAAGDFFYQDLQKQGIETNLDSGVRAAARTGKCIVIILPDADRVLNSFLGANACLAVADINQAALENSEFFFIEPFLSIMPHAKATVVAAREIAQKAGCKIAITLTTCRPPDVMKSDLLSMIGDGVDLLFCNEYEAKLFCQSDDIDAIKNTFKDVAQQFVITRGNKGALLYDGKSFLEIPGYPVTPVDTTGAGDVFAGAFLYAITHGKDFFAAGNFACQVAAKCVLQFGARLSMESVS